MIRTLAAAALLGVVLAGGLVLAGINAITQETWPSW